LRNEAFVTGKVVDYDGHMNLNLEEVEMVDPSGAHLTFPNFYVQNRLIRYVQIPSDVDLQEALQQLGNHAAGRGRGRAGREEISRQRQSILAKRDKRRQEDIRNAIEMGAAMSARMTINKTEKAD